LVERVRVAVLGVTGVVGQRFVQLLSNHPWFEIAYLAASEASAGKRYFEAVEWVVEGPLPQPVGDMVLGPPDPNAIPRDVEVVFSALPSGVAAGIEVELAKRGFTVVSNASPMRLDGDVPLVNPEVNWEHLRLVEVQRKRRGWRGCIIKNPNCTTAILTLSLKPLVDAFGLRRVIVTTLQAVSGAGLRGVPSMAVIDNVIPYIEGEEEKVRRESRKILGRLAGEGVEEYPVEISATTTRVPVLDGHLESVHVELREPAGVEEAAEVMAGFRSKPQELGLPTAPEKPIVVRREPDRPQPRLDRLEGGGMSVVVGRLEEAHGLGRGWLKYVVLGHNAVRGAAGAAVLIAELYLKLEGLV